MSGSGVDGVADQGGAQLSVWERVKEWVHVGAQLRWGPLKKGGETEARAVSLAVRNMWEMVERWERWLAWKDLAPGQ